MQLILLAYENLRNVERKNPRNPVKTGKMTDAVVAAVGGVPDLFKDPIWQDEEETMMDLVTGSQFSQVNYYMTIKQPTYKV